MSKKWCKMLVMQNERDILNQRVDRQFAYFDNFNSPFEYQEVGKNNCSLTRVWIFNSVLAYRELAAICGVNFRTP